MSAHGTVPHINHGAHHQAPPHAAAARIASRNSTMNSTYEKYKTRIGYTLCAFSVAILTVSVLKPLVDSAPSEAYKQMYQTILVFMCVCPSLLVIPHAQQP